MDLFTLLLWIELALLWPMWAFVYLAAMLFLTTDHLDAGISDGMSAVRRTCFALVAAGSGVGVGVLIAVFLALGFVVLYGGQVYVDGYVLHILLTGVAAAPAGLLVQRWVGKQLIPGSRSDLPVVRSGWRF